MSFKVRTNVCKHLPSNKDDHSKRIHSQNIPCKLSSSEISGLIQCCDVDAVVNKTCGTDNLFCVQWLLTYYWSVATWPSVVVLFKRFWWIILFVFISSKLQCWHKISCHIWSCTNNTIWRSQSNNSKIFCNNAGGWKELACSLPRNSSFLYSRKSGYF